MMTVSKPNCIDGLSSISNLYDGFLIDQWGVIHNGATLYPNAKETLQRLKDEDKKVIILTNSSKTNEVNTIRLDQKFGITPDLYTHIVSSADLLRTLLLKREAAPWANFGRRMFVVADGNDAQLLDGTGLQRVYDINDADAVVLLSISIGEDHKAHKDWINLAVRNGLAVVCPSADILSVHSKGVVGGMASVVTDIKAKGGYVVNVGKPEPIIYDLCTALLGDIEAKRILAIGDQLSSDVFGAKRYGFDAALVATGAAPLTFPLARNLFDIANAAFSMSNPPSLRPDWVMEELQWKADCRNQLPCHPS